MREEGKVILYIRPDEVTDLKKKLREYGLENCARSNQILAYLDGGKDRWLEFHHNR
jgi:hypothetical protein